LLAHNNGAAIKEANASTSFNLEKKPKKATTAEAFGFDSSEEKVEEIVDEKVEELVVEEEETFEL
jgi:hypothetical protein